MGVCFAREAVTSEEVVKDAPLVEQKPGQVADPWEQDTEPVAFYTYIFTLIDLLVVHDIATL